MATLATFIQSLADDEQRLVHRAVQAMIDASNHSRFGVFMEDLLTALFPGGFPEYPAPPDDAKAQAAKIDTLQTQIQQLLDAQKAGTQNAPGTTVAVLPPPSE